MKHWRRIAAGGILFVMLMGILTGCKTQEAEKRQITLKVKLPPLTVANADTGITDSYEVLNRARHSPPSTQITMSKWRL